MYPRALQHTLVGCYLSILCLIGLFAIRAAVGPLVLMIVFGIFCVLYHVSVASAINPLLYYLPRSLEAEEDALMGRAIEEGVMSKHTDGGTLGANPEKERIGGLNGRSDTGQSTLGPAPHKKPTMFTKFFRPDIYTDYATCRRLVPHDFPEILYPEAIEKDAYYNPAITSEMPLLWVPRDAGGVSRQECAHTSKITPMTDEGAFLSEKGAMSWDNEGTNGRPPIYEEPVYY